jgi:predicted nucleic-acid-binding Zn-ribbon protein
MLAMTLVSVINGTIGFMSTEKMNCPKCGTQMNHNADKADPSATLSKSETVDHELAGILEVHACPTCGNTELRKAV